MGDAESLRQWRWTLWWIPAAGLIVLAIAEAVITGNIQRCVGNLGIRSQAGRVMQTWLNIATLADLVALALGIRLLVRRDYAGYLWLLAPIATVPGWIQVVADGCPS